MSLPPEPYHEKPIPSPSESEGGSSATCLPSRIWPLLVAGTLPESEALASLSHAAQCSPCSALLRAAQARIANTATPEEEEFLQKLATSTETGQCRLAAQLLTQSAASGNPSALPASSKSTRKPRGKLLRWPAVGLATAAVFLLAFFIHRAFRPASDTTLLAEAYDKHRLSELRIPGGLAVAIASPTRGKASADVSSSELLKVKLRSQQAFEKNPTDAAVRQTLGRIAVVEHDGETARRQFEMAEALNPNLPHLKFDLGTAYFVLAESTGNPLNYARAIDFFGQHLQDVHQQDPVALFDQGLCWERQNIDSEAIKDFDSALALEKDSAWRKEIERHIQTLKSRDAPSGGAAPKAADFTPAAFLGLKGETPGEYETYLDVSRAWLPRRAQDPQTAEALRQLAAMGARHGDAWLGDMLKQPPTPAEIAAEQTLAKALQASAKGSVDESLAASTEAIKLFQKTGNNAGLLRAKAEHVYDQQMGGHGKECIAEAEPLMKSAGVQRYSWQRGYLQLEVSACHSIQGRYGAGLLAADQASATSQDYELGKLNSRATAFAVADSYRQGHLQDAWKTATMALADCHSLPGSGYRQYQLLVQLEGISGQMDIVWTQAGISRAALQAAVASGNHQTAAYAFEHMGLHELKLGASDEAAKSFASADRMLSTVSPGPSTSLYRADWTADRAKLDAVRRGASAAVRFLASQEPAFSSSDIFALARLHFYTECADLLLKSHQAAESIAKVSRAIDDAERGLDTIRTETERLAWAETDSPAYHVLTLALLDTDRADEALRSWEWLRTAPYRTGSKPRPQTLSTQAAATDITARLPSLPRLKSNALTLVYANLQDQYFAWSISPNPQEPIRARRLTATPTEVRIRASAFARLCADPNSSPRDIAQLGAVLYNSLILPFQDQVNHAREIQLDLDPSLSTLPFAALQHDRQFFGLEHTLLFVPPWWTLGDAKRGKSAAEEDRLPAHPRLLIVRESLTDSSARIPEEYDESKDIAASFPLARTEFAKLYRSGSTLTLVGPPGIDSEAAETDVLHYSGHGLDEDTEERTPSARSGQTSTEFTPGMLKHCRLAVLSACRTLATSGEREDSPDDDPTFERIAFASGATHVVGTRWDVDSAMTRKLMARFYSELAGHETFAEALRRAQQSLQSDSSSSHPYYWAAFQLTGQ